MFRLRHACAVLALSAAIALDPAVARADVVVDWNIIALKTTAAAPFNPPLETRNLAIVHAAMFDAVNSITASSTTTPSGFARLSGASPEAAAVAAARATLLQLYPDQQSMLDASCSASLGAHSRGTGKNKRRRNRRSRCVADDGAARIGRSRGGHQHPHTRRATGRATGIPTPPASLHAALDPGWGSVRPFFLAQRLAVPATRRHRRWRARVLATSTRSKPVGSSVSVIRTQDQTDLARFWIATRRVRTGIVAARQVATARRLTLSQRPARSRLLNLRRRRRVHRGVGREVRLQPVAPGDRHSRSRYRAGNPATDGDPSVDAAARHASFPDYIAGHTTYAAGAARGPRTCVQQASGVSVTLRARLRRASSKPTRPSGPSRP